MIRHILFWNFTEKVKEEHTQEESLRFMQQSVATMNGNIEGLLHAEINRNFAGGYDFQWMLSCLLRIAATPYTAVRCE